MQNKQNEPASSDDDYLVGKITVRQKGIAISVELEECREIPDPALLDNWIAEKNVEQLGEFLALGSLLEGQRAVEKYINDYAKVFLRRVLSVSINNK